MLSKRKLSNSAIRRHVMVLSQILKTAVADGRLGPNVAAGIKVTVGKLTARHSISCIVQRQPLQLDVVGAEVSTSGQLPLVIAGVDLRHRVGSTDFRAESISRMNLQYHP